MMVREERPPSLEPVICPSHVPFLLAYGRERERESMFFVSVCLYVVCVCESRRPAPDVSMSPAPRGAPRASGK